MCDHVCGHVVESDDVEKVGEVSGLPIVKMERRQMLQAVAAGSALAVLPSCSTNPETGATQFILVSEGQMAQLAAQSWNDAKRSEPTLQNTSYNRRLENIGRRIAQSSGRGNQSWDYAVFNSDTKNAFVLPGNRVGFYKGIMDFTDNDDQLAAVVGHEVGHVSGRHAAERYSQALGGQLAITGATIYGASQDMSQRDLQMLQAVMSAGFLYGVILPYSRRHELEADLLGAKYMYGAGYDPRQSVRLWQKMAAENQSRTPSFLSTHPDPAYRAENLSRYINAQGW